MNWIIFLAVCGAVLSPAAVVVAAFITQHKLKEIHLLVNGNLHEALTQIKQLKAEIVVLLGKE